MTQRFIDPDSSLRDLVECYWYIAFSGAPHIDKIIPDGFPEIIFHFGKNYEINMTGAWEQQARSLAAGQIKKHFCLRNTGDTEIFGIKLKPTALRHFFGISMTALTDRVVPLSSIDNPLLNELENKIRKQSDCDQMASATNELLQRFSDGFTPTAADSAVNRIIERKGNVEIQELCKVLNISERHLERLFREWIGLSPKFYARVIRFSNIFKMITSGDPSWTELAYRSGYYDQSHFIKNFKAFTGEDPSRYVFDDPTLANFFLKK